MGNVSAVVVIPTLPDEHYNCKTMLTANVTKRKMFWWLILWALRWLWWCNYIVRRLGWNCSHSVVREEINSQLDHFLWNATSLGLGLCVQNYLDQPVVYFPLEFQPNARHRRRRQKDIQIIRSFNRLWGAIVAATSKILFTTTESMRNSYELWVLHEPCLFVFHSAKTSSFKWCVIKQYMKIERTANTYPFINVTRNAVRWQKVRTQNNGDE